MFTRNAVRMGMAVMACAVLALTLGGCKPAPTVVSTNPADGATAVPVSTTVTATFSREIDPDTINTSTFTLSKGGTPVPGQVTYDASTLTATFTPDNPLDKNSLYTAMIAKGTGVEKDASCFECYAPFLAVPAAIGIIAALAAQDHGLAKDYVWTFTTEGNGIPPVANAGPDQHVNLPLGASTVNVMLDGSLSHDPDGNIVTYAWTGTPDPGNVVKPTVSIGPGPHVFTLTVTDNDGLVSGPDTVTIFVNVPPIADAGPDQNLTLPAGAPTMSVTLDGSLSHDPDGTVVAWAWTGSPNPADVVKPAVTLGPGVYVFTLIVTDDLGAASLPDTVTITVSAAQNIPPVANAGPDQSLNLPLVNSTNGKAEAAATMDVHLDGSASYDVDGTVVTYTWTGSPDPEDIAKPTVNLGAGNHVFTLMVTDDDGAVSATDSVTISVNTPPVAVITATPNPVHADPQKDPTLVYDPTILYGINECQCDAVRLDYLNPADGSVTKSLAIALAGSSWKPKSGLGLAVDPTTGIMWAILEVEEGVAAPVYHRLLVTLDQQTGVAQYVAEFNSGGPLPYDLAITDDGTFYAVAKTPEVKAFTTPGLYIVNKATGALTDVVAFSDSYGYDAIAYIPTLDVLAHAYRTSQGVDVLEEINLSTLATTPVLPALPATQYTWLWPSALTFGTESVNLFLSENIDFTGDLFTIGMTVDGGVETEIQHHNSVYGGLAFGYIKRGVAETVQLDGSSSYDPDGDTITSYAWSVVSVPVGSAITEVSNSTIVNPTLTPDVLGDYVVRLVVSDGKALSAPTDYTVTYENSAPVADAGNDVTIPNNLGAEACLDGSGSYDADFDALNYSWAVTDSGGNPVAVSFFPSATSAAGCITFSATPMPGVYTATLIVAEAKTGGLIDTDTATITVTAPAP